MTRYYTPLRYPGGKAKLARFVKEVFRLNGLCDGHYVEPYAGGAGVGIELLLCGYASTIHLNDLNYPVYAFWHSLLNHPDRMCKRIKAVKLTVNTWKRQRRIIQNARTNDPFDVGFAFLYLNRTNRSGIINGGVIGGFDQSGTWKIDARFNRDNLVERVQRIASFSQQIILHNMDASAFLTKVRDTLPKKSFIFLDPPYFHQGQKLYDNFYEPKDHALIADRVAKLRTPWMVSYDDEPAVRSLYGRFRQTTHYLRYTAATAYQGAEALIFSKGLKLPESVESRLLKTTY